MSLIPSTRFEQLTAKKLAGLIQSDITIPRHIQTVVSKARYSSLWIVIVQHAGGSGRITITDLGWGNKAVWEGRFKELKDDQKREEIAQKLIDDMLASRKKKVEKANRFFQPKARSDT